MLSDEEVIEIVRRHLESKFPKECARCRRRYDSLASYLLGTTHVGSPVSADDPFKAIQPAKLVGVISYANCPCGSTLAVTSAGMTLATMWRLLRWAGASMSRRHMSMGEVLSDLRRRIDEQVLREHAAQNPGAAVPPVVLEPIDDPGAASRSIPATRTAIRGVRGQDL